LADLDEVLGDVELPDVQFDHAASTFFPLFGERSHDRADGDDRRDPGYEDMRETRAPERVVSLLVQLVPVEAVDAVAGALEPVDREVREHARDLRREPDAGVELGGDEAVADRAGRDEPDDARDRDEPQLPVGEREPLAVSDGERRQRDGTAEERDPELGIEPPRLRELARAANVLERRREQVGARRAQSRSCGTWVAAIPAARSTANPR
jgi:hypothetical protein